VACASANASVFVCPLRIRTLDIRGPYLNLSVFVYFSLFLCQVYCCVFYAYARARRASASASTQPALRAPLPCHGLGTGVRSNTTLPISRQLASRPPARATIKGPSSAWSLFVLVFVCFCVSTY
jgi:hypothetical protein